MKFEKVVYPSYRVEIAGAQLIDPQYHWMVERPKGYRTPTKTPDLFLRGKAHCPLCGMQMLMNFSTEKPHFWCNRSHDRGARRPYLSNNVLEDLAMRCVRDVCDRASYDKEFAQAVRSEVQVALEGFRRTAAELARRYEIAEREYEQALGSTVGHFSAGVQRDLVARTEKLRLRKAKAWDTYAHANGTADDIARLLETLDGRFTGIAAQLSELQITHPWLPADAAERSLRADVAEMIRSVRVDLEEKSAVATFEMVLMKSSHADFEVVRTLSIEDATIRSKYDWRSGPKGLIADRFEESAVRLTDAEFRSLPRMPRPFNKADDIRLYVDVLLVAAELNLEPCEVLWPIGRHRCVPRIRELRRGPALDVVIGHLKLHRGEQFDLPRPEPMPHGTERMRLVAMRDPILLVDLCDPLSDRTGLSDEQWDTIADIFTRSRNLYRIGGSTRKTLDGYFALVRQGLGLKMAHRVDADANAISRLVRAEFRHQFVEMTRRLLSLQGICLPESYVARRRRSGQHRLEADPAAVLAEMRAGMARCDPGAPTNPRYFTCGGLRFNLMTGEASDGARRTLRMPLNSRQLLRCLLDHAGEVVSHGALQTALVIHRGNPRPHLIAAVADLRRWLRVNCPELAGRLETVRGVGYRVVRSVDTQEHRAW